MLTSVDSNYLGLYMIYGIFVVDPFLGIFIPGRAQRALIKAVLARRSECRAY